MNYEDSTERLQNAIDFLSPRGFGQLSGWQFVKACKVYDLSAADLLQIDRIEREGLFLVERQT